MQLDQAAHAARAAGSQAVAYRRPRKADGARIWDMIKSIEALDDNSMYCNLLQCSHFAGTCALAEIGGKPIGWISGYLPPEPDRRRRPPLHRLPRRLLVAQLRP
jgi:L-2,4-diaminobutyric acid acetyltransferase